MGCEMSKSMAKDVLLLLNTFPNEKKGVHHILTPGRKSGVSINNDVGKGLEPLSVSLIHSEGDLVVDVIVKVIVVPNSFGDFVSKVNSFGEDGFDVFIEVVESEFSLLCFLVAIDEENQHVLLLYWDTIISLNHCHIL